MAKVATATPVIGLEVDRKLPAPLSRQLYDRLREAMLAGQLAEGHRLPSTRQLGGELGVSRNTVMLAYEQLAAEGYLEGQVGSGTRVARILPETLLHASTPRSVGHTQPSEPLVVARVEPSRRGAMLARLPAMPSLVGLRADGGPAFRTGMPAFDLFPLELWGRLVARSARRLGPDLLDYQGAAGHRPLREAIAAYVGAARGVRCTADQVIVVAGAQSALDLAARVLLDPDDAAWIEDPGYLGVRGALHAAGAQLVPVPVDGEGLDVAAGIARHAGARLVYVTPSHQFPTGATMSLGRRLALLDWAARSGAWIVEDDYDGEYRYAGRPLPALQGLRPDGRVIYVGTFSKALFPALRLGYLIAPPALVEPFLAARHFVDVHPPALEQATLAEFIGDGHFGRHIRRMRALYQARSEALVAAARREFDGLLKVGTPTAGMHVVGWLPPGVDDQEASRHAAFHGVTAAAVSSFALEPVTRGGLVLGFSATDEAAIDDGVRRLTTALQSLV